MVISHPGRRGFAASGLGWGRRVVVAGRPPHAGESVNKRRHVEALVTSSQKSHCLPLSGAPSEDPVMKKAVVRPSGYCLVSICSYAGDLLKLHRVYARRPYWFLSALMRGAF